MIGSADRNGRMTTGREPWRYRRQASATTVARALRRMRGLPRLELLYEGVWDPEEEYWGEPEEPIDELFAPIIAGGCRPCHEMEQVLPGADIDDDDIVRSGELRRVGLPRQASALLRRLLRQDYRCVDAHCHLGNVAFDLDPAEALPHYEMGIAIAEMALPEPFTGVLPWTMIDNRPFLRCLHGFAITLWRLGRFEDAEAVMVSLLWLNPSDQQGVRFILPVVRARLTWRDDENYDGLQSGGDRGPAMPAPDPDRVRESAEAAPILAQLRALTRFIGEGRRLTGTGNLTLADARVLIELAATGDAMEEHTRSHTFRVRSAAELRRLSYLVTWARAAGLTRTVHGRITCTRRGRRLAEATALAPFFDEVADALVKSGPLSLREGPVRRYRSEADDELLDALVPRLVLEPYLAGGSVPFDRVATGAAATVMATFVVAPEDEERTQRMTFYDVWRIYDSLRLAGVVRVDGLPGWDDLRPWSEQLPGTVELTEAGADWVGRRYGAASVLPFRSPR